MSKSIYFISNGLSGGGAERVMALLANNLVKSEYNVSFLMLKKYPEEYVLDKKINVIYKEKIKRRDFIGDIRFIRTYMKKDKNALYISFFTRQNLYTLLASFGLRTKIIVSERNDPRKTVNNKFEQILRDYLYSCKNCKRIVFQTPGAKQMFNRNIQKKGLIIINPIKRNLPYKNTYKNINKTIVSVGRLNEQKNYPLLISSFTEFKKTHEGYKLLIYGKGEQEDSLKELCKKLNVQDDVVFKGFVKNIHQKLIDCDMYVISSDYEGLSNALLEAMSIGMPCISTDSPPGGARTVIDDGVNGLLVPIKNKNLMTEALCKLADDNSYARELGENAKYIRKIADEDIVIEKWKNLFDECISKN